MNDPSAENESAPDAASASEPYRADLLAGEHVLVTGGGTGLGAAMSARFCELGATVTICGRRRAPLEQTVAALRAAGGRAEGVPCDVRDPDKVTALLDEAERRAGPVTRLVNNAAGNFLSLSEDLEPRGFDAVIAINLYGSAHVTLACGRRWIERGGGGAVVSIGTTYADTGGPFVMPSAASKAAIVAMSKSLAVEWGRHGIRLNVIAPGPIPTKGAWTRLMPDPTFEQRMRDGVPLGRFATSRGLGDLAAFLLSEASSVITGQVIELDGGARLAGHGSFAELLALGEARLRHTFEALRPPRKSSPSADEPA